MNSITPSVIASNAINASSAGRSVDARVDAPDFSYALAAATLERQASQSLKAHGAAPGAASAPSQAPRGRDQATYSTADAAVADETTAPESPGPDKTATPVGGASAGRQTAAVTGAVAPPALLATPVAASTPGAQGAARIADAIAAREAATRSETSKAAAPAKAPAPTATPRPEFAEVLARRLEKTSVFEMRLDPPEHGRVEGRLAIADDGKAILSLTFDNQNAFDLFSRDEQLLRQTLTQAGLDFAAGDFRFSYREPLLIEGAADFGAATGPVAGRNYEAVFYAEWSAGALDILI